MNADGKIDDDDVVPIAHTPMYRKSNMVLHWNTDIRDGLSVLYSLEQPKLTSYMEVPDFIPSQVEKSATFCLS